jgi:ubiquinone/menaquinone biosynthesis C-methylase UbiE
VSIDLDSYSLKRLKQKNKQTHIIRADARNIPLKKSIFDAILIIEVLDYIPELNETINECYRILKRNSVLALSFGNKSSLKSQLKKIYGKSYSHSYREVVQCLLRAGFSITKKMGYNWLPYGRTSESKGVPLIAGAENIFRLRTVPRYSPWVLICAVKN